MKLTRLFDFIQYQIENYPMDKSVGGKKDGKWQYYSTSEIIERANKMSCGLLKLGVQRGDKVALITYQNRPEWTVMDLAIQQVGAINVPVYPTISSGEYEYIFNDASIKYCFVGSGDLYDKVEKARPQIPTLKEIYTLDKQAGRKYWEDLYEETGMDEVQKIMDSIQSEELATLIYTSGTTGHPKGVMLSHKNICSNVFSVKDLLPTTAGDDVLSFLPICHIFERSASYAYILSGARITLSLIHI